MNKRSLAILTLILGVIIGYAVHSLFVSSNLPATVSTKQIAVAIKAQQQQQMQYEAKLKNLITTNEHLEVQLDNTNAQLRVTSANNKTLVAKVSTQAKNYVHERASSSDATGCDSLVITVAELLVNNLHKDSLYDAALVNLQQQVAIKDSTLVLQQQRMDTLYVSVTHALNNQQALLHENKHLKKQARKQRLKEKLSSAATILLGGVAVWLTVSH